MCDDSWIKPFRRALKRFICLNHRFSSTIIAFLTESKLSLIAHVSSCGLCSWFSSTQRLNKSSINKIKYSITLLFITITWHTHYQILHQKTMRLVMNLSWFFLKLISIEEMPWALMTRLATTHVSSIKICINMYKILGITFTAVNQLGGFFQSVCL